MVEGTGEAGRGEAVKIDTARVSAFLEKVGTIAIREMGYFLNGIREVEKKHKESKPKKPEVKVVKCIPIVRKPEKFEVGVGIPQLMIKVGKRKS